MDHPFPPRPALFLRLMPILNPSMFRQLFSNLWVTHPILKPLLVDWLDVESVARRAVNTRGNHRETVRHTEFRASPRTPRNSPKVRDEDPVPRYPRVLATQLTANRD